MMRFRMFSIGTLNMVQKKYRPLVLCGPSGSGKSTLIKRIFNEFSDLFGFSISHTTRKPRANEQDGREYYFISREEMQSQIDDGNFLEIAYYGGNIYGSSKKAVQDVQLEGKVCVLDIDTQGVKQIKKSSLDPIFVFIKPPSIAELERRLRDRNTETEESLSLRLTAAKEEIEYGEQSGNFHLIIVNNKVEKAYETLREFILAEIKKQNDAENDSST
ncbi:guanylate kinase isoform X2 [Leptopilina heterotoma]|uniref:guanylate kinase isoform X2 n=1 Tax=Leptopilina heterotoma TaxID=63436 RepID=UPI001CA86C76|nr:guanylate kinase isoform X2 [Leptopilina heterotoma]